MDYKPSRSSTLSRTRNMTAANGRRTANRARINRKKYGALLAETLPRVIETTEELERLTREIEPLLDKGGEARPAEEEELCRLALRLIGDYQRARRLIPSFKPHELLHALLEESGK